MKAKTKKGLLLQFGYFFLAMCDFSVDMQRRMNALIVGMTLIERKCHPPQLEYNYDVNLSCEIGSSLALILADMICGHHKHKRPVTVSEIKLLLYLIFYLVVPRATHRNI